MDDKKHFQVIVVGAGLAGLTAAVTLLQNKIDILIVEQENRVGGRIKSDLVGNFPCNLGAQWIHTGIHPAVDPYIEKLQIQETNKVVVVWDGKPVQIKGDDFIGDMPISDQAKKDLILASNQMRKDADILFQNVKCVFDLTPNNALWEKLEKQTITEYLSPYHPEIMKLWGDRVSAGFGGTPDDISALDLVAWYRGNPFIPMAILKGGNQKVAEVMLDDCKKEGAEIALGIKIKEIVQEKENIIVRCDTGREYSADYVVVTVPASMVNEIVTGLSPKKREALLAVQYNPLVEIGMHVQNIPGGETMSGFIFFGKRKAAAGGLNQTGEVAGHPDNGTVISLTVTDKQILKLPDKEMLANVAEDMKMAYPDFSPEKDILEYRIQRWEEGEVHMTPGFLSKYRDLLKEPAGNIYFAGDYVSDFPTWGGAVWSGEKAAKEIVRATRK
jgi:monoamine oxidase